MGKKKGAVVTQPLKIVVLVCWMPLESQHGSYRSTGVFIVAQVFYPSAVREID